MANKTSNIIMRVSELEKARIRRAAQEQRMSVSEWILFLVRKELATQQQQIVIETGYPKGDEDK